VAGVAVVAAASTQNRQSRADRGKSAKAACVRRNACSQRVDARGRAGASGWSRYAGSAGYSTTGISDRPHRATPRGRGVTPGRGGRSIAPGRRVARSAYRDAVAGAAARPAASTQNRQTRGDRGKSAKTACVRRNACFQRTDARGRAGASGWSRYAGSAGYSATGGGWLRGGYTGRLRRPFRRHVEGVTPGAYGGPSSSR